MGANPVTRWSAPWWPLVLPVGLAVWTQLEFPPQYDETAHAHFTRYIAEHPTWHTLVTYEGSENYEAKAPFVFVVGALVGSIAGFTLPVLRFLVLLFTLIGVCYFHRLVRLFRIDVPGSFVAGIVGIPYFLILSLTYMTDMPTLALMFVSAYGLLRNIEESSVGHLLGGMLASTAMLYTRIDAVFILAGIGLAYSAYRALPFRVLLGILIPVLLRLPLVILWGGLAAPPARLRPVPVQAGFLPMNVVFSLCVVGLYFFPFALQGLTERLRLRGVATALALLLLAACAPHVSDLNNPDPDFFGGALRSLLVATTPATGLPRILVLAVLFLVGCQVVLTYCLPAPGQDLRLLALQLSCALGLGMQGMRGEVMYERYLFPTFGFLYLLILSRNPRNVLWHLWFAGVVALQLVQLHQHQHHVI
jgi:hypothetical protein